MNTCKTCRWWSHPDAAKDCFGFGSCDHPKLKVVAGKFLYQLQDGTNFDSYELVPLSCRPIVDCVTVTDPDQHDCLSAGAMWISPCQPATGPDFGCIHHEGTDEH